MGFYDALIRLRGAFIDSHGGFMVLSYDVVRSW